MSAPLGETMHIEVRRPSRVRITRPGQRQAAVDAIDKAPRQSRGVRTALLGILAFLVAWSAIVMLWEVGVAQGWLNGRVLPPPSSFVPYLWHGAGSAGIGYNKVTYQQAIFDTLARVFIGFVIGLTAAIGVATLVCSLKPFRFLVLPVVQTIAPIAPVAWIPLAISLMGIGSNAAIFVVALGIFGGVATAAVAAFDGVPKEHIHSARLLGAHGARLWWRVMLPAATPALVTVARLSFFGAWMAVLAGEMAGISSGLGALIMLGQQQFNMRLVMVGIVTIGVLGFAVDRLLLLAARRIVWWEQRGTRQQ